MKKTPNNPTPAVTEGVFHALLRSWGLLRQSLDPYFVRFGTSSSQWGILRVLQRAELKGEKELPLKVVSERLLIRPASVTGVVDRLERLGYVRRNACTKDLRVRHLSLTERGRDLMAKVLVGHPQKIQSLFAALQPAEQEIMFSLLKRLEAHLKALATAPADFENESGKTRKRRVPGGNPLIQQEPRQKARGMNSRKARAIAGGAAAAALLAGCAVGPNYQRPSALGTNAMPAAFAGTVATNFGEWKRAAPSAHLPRGTWWELFEDPELNLLETKATAGNQEIALALANFEQARALVNVARSDLFPQASTTPSYNRQRTSLNIHKGDGATYNTFTIPLEASWELDVWGRIRRGVEGARARLAASGDDVESARLAIQAEVAIDYFALRAFEAQRRLLEETAVAYRRSLELTRNRHKSGIATELDVSQAETQLAATEAQIPDVELQRANLLHALATLCGKPAGAFEIQGSQATGDGAVPAIPVSMPSELLESRPDIAAAERRMAAANADIGVATSAFYPRVFLSGLAGYQSIDAGTLFDWPSRVWSVGPTIELPLFTGGRNRAQLAAAHASYEATTANYRLTVLSAFQEVEDQLAAQRLLSAELDAEKVALKSARRTLEISASRYKGGLVTYLEVAIAQSSAFAHEETVVQLTARRQASAVSLIKALGAGWDARDAGSETASLRSEESTASRSRN